MSKQAEAYLIPKGEGEGLIRFAGDGRRRKYYLGYRKLEFEKGYYSVTYTEKVQSYEGRNYVVIYLDDVTPAEPTDREALKMILEAAVSPRKAEAIFKRLPQNWPVERTLEMLSDWDFLTSVPGIGPSYAQRILQELESFNNTEYRIVQVLKRWGYRYGRERERDKWARLFYSRYPEELKELEQNPYHLLTIADRGRYSVRALMAEYDLHRLSGFSLDDIDPQILETDPRWASHYFRVQAYLERALKRVMKDGHSVALLDQMIAALRREGITGITEKLNEEPSPLSPDILRAMVRRTDNIKNVHFTTYEGESAWGVTFEWMLLWQKTISSTVSTLTRTKTPFSTLQTERMYQHALNAAGFELTPEQKQGLKNAFHSCISAVTGGPGTGKGLAIDTPLPTPTGWTTIGDLKVGDQLIDEQGHPCNVTYVTEEQHRKCYEVEFDDGSIIIADDVHRWLTSTRASRRSAARQRTHDLKRHGSDQSHKRVLDSVVTTEEIAKTLHVGIEKRRNHAIMLAQALDLPEQDLAVDPWVLGLWLGDGGTAGGSITVGAQDLEEIIQLLEAAGERPEFKERRLGVFNVVCKRPNKYACERGHTYTYRRPDNNKRQCHICTENARRVRQTGNHALHGPKVNQSLCRRLRTLGVLGNKHIPSAYLRASKAQRLALLQGILDADGHATKRQGNVEITLTNEQLAKDTYDLVCGLGIKASWNERDPILYGQQYRIGFTTDVPVFRLQRKLAQLPTNVRTTQKQRYIVDVREVETVPTRCLTVDSESHLFLAGHSYIPTHNTSLSQAFLNGIQLVKDGYRHTNPLSPGRGQYRTGFNVYIVAPTGVAAQRIRLGLRLLDPLTGELRTPEKIDHGYVRILADAKGTVSEISDGKICLGTLHSFLGYNGHTYNLPPAHPSVIFLDEASMVDEEVLFWLMLYLESCLEADIPCLLLLSGDQNQLPPVGTGFPFRDILHSASGAVIPTTRLTEVKRQGKGSMIVHVCQEILKLHQIPTLEDYERWELDAIGEDFLCTDAEPGATLIEMLLEHAEFLREKTGEDVSERDIQVILPLRNPSSVEPTACYTRAANTDLQEFFAERDGNKIHELSYTIRDGLGSKKYLTTRLAVGDRVIHTGENGYHGNEHEPIMRGSIGEITDIHDGIVRVKYGWVDDEVTYANEELDGLDLAYAITCHAAQGSEFDYVLLVVPRRAAPTLIDRPWLYTAISRAKQHLLLIATSYRLARGVRESYSHARNTLLAKEIVKAA